MERERERERGLAFVPTMGRGMGFASLRPLGLVSRVAARAILNSMGSALKPELSNGYAYRRGGRVDLAIMPTRLAADERREQGEYLFLLQLDVAGAVGSVDYQIMWRH